MLTFYSKQLKKNPKFLVWTKTENENLAARKIPVARFAAYTE